MLNMVIVDGTVRSLALRYDDQGKAELRWTLEQQSGEFSLWLPCFTPGAAAERLAGELEEGMHICITSGRLAYRKRASKTGTEQSRLEILTWQVEVISTPDSKPQDERRDTGEGDRTSDEHIVAPDVAGEAPLGKKGKPRYPKWTGKASALREV